MRASIGMGWVLLLLVVGVMTNANLCAQIEAGSGPGEERPAGISLRFIRQNNVTWYSFADFRYRFQKDRYRLEADLHHENIFNSSLDSDRFVQLFFSSSIWQYYRLTPKLDAISWIETNQFLNTQNEKYNAYGGVEYRPFSFLKVRPLVGYSLDRRAGRLDHGFSPALRLESVYEWESGLSQQTRLFARYKRIQPRRQHNLNFDQVWTKVFETEEVEGEGATRNGSIVAGIYVASNELDDYAAVTELQLDTFPAWDTLRTREPVVIYNGTGPIDTSNYVDKPIVDLIPTQGYDTTVQEFLTVKRILSDSVRPFFNLNYALSSRWNWDSRNEVQFHRRRFLYEAQDREQADFSNLAFTGLEVRSRQTLSYLGKKLRGFAFYEFESRNRRYELENNRDFQPAEFERLEQREKQKDFESRQHLIEAEAQWQTLPRHQLKIRYSGKYKQYDTPAEDNFDDRDEITYLANAEWVGSWRPGFRTRYGISGAYRHYAFLFQEKSQDNYKQRTLRLLFDFDWDFWENWRLNGHNAIYVTYNVKDFIDFNLTDRSTRNLETNYRLEYRPSSDFHSKLTMNRRETHQSYLNWESFTETTLDTTIFLTLESSNRYFWHFPEKKIRIYGDVGYKHFDQTKRLQSSMFNLNNELKSINLRQINLQTGPVLAIGLRGSRQSSIDLSVWFQYQIRKNKFKETNGVNLYGTTQNEADLRERSALLFPYVNLNLNYFLN